MEHGKSHFLILTIIVFWFVCLSAMMLSLGSKVAAASDPAPNLLLGSISDPKVPQLPWQRTDISVAPCTDPPRIDGVINDPCWQNATHAAGFYRYFGTAPISQQTEAWICADKTYLYIAFHCLDSAPRLIHRNETQRDGSLDTDDYVGVDIDSHGARRGVSSFLVTAGGVQNEVMEDGTANNITWAGDWRAAAKTTPDGWTAELAIPFRLLHYPRGNHSFGILLYRRLARETNLECWPYLPPEGTATNMEAEYLNDFTNLNLPEYTPHPVYLPYVLATAGDGSSVRSGIDIKYPISTTLTGLASLFPDFQTIEQNVANINFSYTPKYLGDARPFFAEGANMFPASDIFYSLQIPTVDEGIKVVGKQGDTTLGLLAMNAHQEDSQDAYVFNVAQNLGAYSQVGVQGIQNSHVGVPSNQVDRLFGNYGWVLHGLNYSISSQNTRSHLGDRETGQDSSQGFSVGGANGRPSIQITHTDISPDFVNQLGYVPEVDLRGTSLLVGQQNEFDKGPLEIYSASVTLDSYQHHSGGFFHKQFTPTVYLGLRTGWGFSVSDMQSQREIFHDRVTSATLSWGNKTLFDRGSYTYSYGRQEGMSYRFQDLSQSFLITRSFSAVYDVNMLDLGDYYSQQTIVTGTYRLNQDHTVGGRLIVQDGASNVYFSFTQHVRSGSDIYLIYGNPNSQSTQNKITMKIVRPF